MQFSRKTPNELRTVEATLCVPGPWNEHKTRIIVTGNNPYERDHLWRYAETWSFSEQQQGLEPCDALHYLFLLARQDRPLNQEGLNRALQGLPPHEQLALFREP